MRRRSMLLTVRGGHCLCVETLPPAERVAPSQDGNAEVVAPRWEASRHQQLQLDGHGVD